MKQSKIISAIVQISLFIYDKKSGKFWKWFNSYKEATNYSPTI